MSDETDTKTEAPKPPATSNKFFNTVINPIEKPLEKKAEVYKNPKYFADITQGIFKSIGLRAGDFLGYTKDGREELAEWDIKGGQARYPKSKQSKIDRKKKTEQGLIIIPTPPKLGVSQAKNIDALGFMLQLKNWRRVKDGKEKKAELEFSLKEYAKIRGYKEAEIARGGGFLAELKKDLFTGAYTTYRLEQVIIDGKEYTAHGLPNIYILLEPKSRKDKWKIVYNEPYKNYYINSKQYYPILLEAIQDKKTDGEKGYLYSFFKLVMSYASKGDFRTQLRVSTLLDKIKAGDRTKERPQEAFSFLAECIYYTATKYGAIEEVRFFDSGKCEKVEVIKDPARFKEWDFNDFTKEVLTPLGLTDIRKALISFNTPPELAEATDDTGQDEPTI